MTVSSDSSDSISHCHTGLKIQKGTIHPPYSVTQQFQPQEVQGLQGLDSRLGSCNAAMDHDSCAMGQIRCCDPGHICGPGHNACHVTMDHESYDS